MRILYIVYWGACEPLGRSLILPAVRQLARLGACLTLVTFEKPHDWQDAAQVGEVRRSLDESGVTWIPLRYHKRPKVPATAFDVLHGWGRGLLQRLTGRFDVVHARTFIGGLIGRALAPWLGARLVYHNEGFYPDEQVDAGVWREGSFPHRLAKRLENQLYSRADGLVVLSQRAREQVEQLPNVARKHTPLVVVPSCVDLERFALASRPPVAMDGRLNLVYAGSVGGRYRFEHMARFAAVSRRRLPQLHFRVLSQSDPELVASLLQASGLPTSAWSLTRVPHEQVPAELGRQDAGIHFLARGLSEHGGSPTKVGEYWACGLPVVITPNVSDTEQVILAERVGVVVRDHAEQEYLRCARELADLVLDPDLRPRCRRAAEEHYSLTAGCQRQFELYHQLVGPGRRRSTAPAKPAAVR